MDAAESRYNEWLSGVCYLIYQRRVMSQTELARQTGAAREHVNAVLRGRTAAGQNLQEQITNVLGTTYDDLRALGRNTSTDGIQIPSAQPAASQGAFGSVMTAFALQVSEWWRTVTGDQLTDAMAFSAEFERRFPEFLAWRQALTTPSASSTESSTHEGVKA